MSAPLFIFFALEIKLNSPPLERGLDLVTCS